MMEGVASEASSLAGHLGLGKLCVVYDDNRISIEGSTDLAFSDDVAGRYASYGWHVQKLDDGWTLDDLRLALANARAEDAWPSLVIARTHIAAGAPNAHDTAEAHGAPLGPDEVRATKVALGADPDRAFVVPEDVAKQMDVALQGQQQSHSWQLMFGRYKLDHQHEYAELDRVLRGALPYGWDASLPDFAGEAPMATRVASGRALNLLAGRLPEIVGGSADLAPSTNTLIEEAASVTRWDMNGRNRSARTASRSVSTGSAHRHPEQPSFTSSASTSKRSSQLRPAFSTQRLETHDHWQQFHGSPSARDVGDRPKSFPTRNSV